MLEIEAAARLRAVDKKFALSRAQQSLALVYHSTSEHAPEHSKISGGADFCSAQGSVWLAERMPECQSRQVGIKIHGYVT